MVDLQLAFLRPARISGFLHDRIVSPPPGTYFHDILTELSCFYRRKVMGGASAPRRCPIQVLSWLVDAFKLRDPGVTEPCHTRVNNA